MSRTGGRIAVGVRAVDRASPIDAGSLLLLLAVWPTEQAVARVTTSEKRPSNRLAKRYLCSHPDCRVPDRGRPTSPRRPQVAFWVSTEDEPPSLPPPPLVEPADSGSNLTHTRATEAVHFAAGGPDAVGAVAGRARVRPARLPAFPAGGRVTAHRPSRGTGRPIRRRSRVPARSRGGVQPLIRHNGVTDRRRWESALFLKAVRAGQQFRRRQPVAGPPRAPPAPRCSGKPLPRCPCASNHAAAPAGGTLLRRRAPRAPGQPSPRDSRGLRRRVGDV